MGNKILLGVGGEKNLSLNTIYSNNFDTGVDPPTGFTPNNPAEFIVDNSILPVSNGYPGASGNYYYAFVNGSGGLDTLVLSFSTIGYSSISVQWGAYIDPAFPTPIVLEWSINGTIWNVVTYINVTANSLWALIPLINLPVGVNNAANLRLRWSYTSDNTPNYAAIDDIIITGYQ